MEKQERDLFQTIDTKEKAEVQMNEEKILPNDENQEPHDEGPTDQKETRMKSERMIREVLSYVLIILLAYFIATFISKHVVTFVRVEMSSMEPTLYEGDKLILWRLGKLERFDIVVFEDPRKPGKYLIKRLIGVPGDYLEYKNNQLYLNGEPLQEDYIKDGIYRPEEDYTLEKICSMSGVSECFTADGVRIPEGYYFVLGDNRQVSIDSDDEEIGLVREELFQGKVIFRTRGGFGRVK